MEGKYDSESHTFDGIRIYTRQPPEERKLFLEKCIKKTYQVAFDELFFGYTQSSLNRFDEASLAQKASIAWRVTFGVLLLPITTLIVVGNKWLRRRALQRELSKISI